MNFPNIFTAKANDINSVEPTIATNASHSSNEPLRVNLEDYGFTQAGKHSGSSVTLRNLLEFIRQARIVDERYQTMDENARKQVLEQEKSSKQEEIADVQKEKNVLENIKIPSVQSEMEDKKREILEIEKSIATGNAKSAFSWVRFLMYASLTVLLGLYLLFFYAAAINSAFFRSLDSMLQGLDRSGLELLMSSIFDTSALFVWSDKLIIMYLGACIFFALGLVPHYIWNEVSHKYAKWIGVVFFLVLALIFEMMIAYKIDLFIYDVRKLVDPNIEPMNHWTSPNFWLVVFFGYVTYVIWSIIFEAMLHEWGKRDTHSVKYLEIKYIKKKIKELKSQLDELKEQLLECNSKLDKLQLQLDAIQKRIDSAALNPKELLKNIENFYNGWLKFLNNCADKDLLVAESESVYKQFKEENFSKIFE